MVLQSEASPLMHCRAPRFRFALKVRHRLRGTHRHVSVFIGNTEQELAFAGDLVFQARDNFDNLLGVFKFVSAWQYIAGLKGITLIVEDEDDHTQIKMGRWPNE